MENNSLAHYGVLGMKWGVRRYQNQDGSLTPAGKKKYTSEIRKARGHAGPGVYLGSTKRQLAGAKKDLELLDKGAHLSIGVTKKRQEAYDKRDRALLEKKIATLEAKEAAKTKTKPEPHDDYKKAHEPKSVKNMSDAELRNRLNRIQMEKQYAQLSPSAVGKGKDYVNKTIKAGTTVAAITTTGLTIYNNVDKIRKIIGK